MISLAICAMRYPCKGPRIRSERTISSYIARFSLLLLIERCKNRNGTSSRPIIERRDSSVKQAGMNKQFSPVQRANHRFGQYLDCSANPVLLKETPPKESQKGL